MIRSLLSLLVVLGVAASPALAQDAHQHGDHGHGHAHANGTEMVLKVDGFQCDMCAAKLQEKLKGFEEVDRIDTEAWEEGYVKLHLKPDAQIEQERLVETVREAGFVLREIRIGDEVTVIET
jgi:copper chaperone CopZ